MRRYRSAVGRPGWAKFIPLLVVVAAGTWPRNAVAQEDGACNDQQNSYETARANFRQNPTPANRAAMDSTRTGYQRCVDITDSTRAADALKLMHPEAARLGQIPIMIPEYHDEGRLPLGSATNLLGPMAYIYASPFLGDFTRRGQLFSMGVPGIVAAVVVIRLGPGETLPTQYSALGLQAGKNCIWLYATGKQNVDPLAVYISYPADPDPCDRAAPRQGPYTPYERKETGHGHASFPGAARFDSDNNLNPVIGFKCLAAFCELGSTAATWRRPVTHPGGGVNSATPPRGIIKGWHDEQYLAVKNGTQWERSPVLANIVPIAAASDKDEDDFNDTWVYAAVMRISGLSSSHKYFTWGLRNGINRVYVQFNTVTRKWQMQIRPAGGSAVTWPDDRTERMKHYDAIVPATVRFRFSALDDGIWVPCGNGCCRSDGGT